MRFRRLDLPAYGKFSDASLELPDGSPDLHLIYGPNEAGKSTLRSAVVDFLYGIPGQTTQNFLHDYKRMLIGAVVEARGRRLELYRRKGNKETLLNAQREPVSDETLGEWLGGSDRAFFERMFALSHERLREGGEEILQRKDDAGEALFAAAAGVRGLHALRAEMDRVAKELWTPRKSKNVDYHRNAELLEAATKAKKEATAQAKDWQEADARLETAKSEYNKAKQCQNELESRRAQLERVRRVAPHLQARREAQRSRAELGGVRLLPADAEETVNAARSRREISNARLSDLEPEVERLKREVSRIHPDQALLGRAAEIEELDNQRRALSRHEGDINKRTGEAATATEAVLRVARRLGWAEAADRALESRSPSGMAKANLRALLVRRGELEQGARTARRNLEDRQADLRDVEDRMQRIAARGVSAEWKQAFTSAGALGDVDARRASLQQAVVKARQAWETAAAELHPWQGTAEDLRLPPPVSAAQAREWIEEQRRCQEALRRMEERARDNSETLRDTRLTRDQLVRESDPVTPEQLRAARGVRDRQWREIASGAVAVSDARTEYEAAVADADTVADRRFEGAEAVGAWTRLTNEIERLERAAQALEDERAAEHARAAALQERWRRVAERLALGDRPLGDYPGWLDARKRALDQAEALRDAEAALAELDAHALRAANLLRERWELEAGEPVAAGDDGLAAWTVRTETKQRSLSGRAARRSRREGQAGEGRRDCERAEQAAAAAEQEWLGWQQQWRQSVVDVGLPETTSPDAGAAALDDFDALDGSLRDLRKLRERIAKMQADLQELAETARRLAEALLPDWAERPASDIAGELNRRLQEARDAAKERDRLAKALEESRKNLAEERKKLADAEASLQPLLHDAGAADLDALREAVARSDQARNLELRIEQLASAARQAGAPLDLAALEAELDAEEGNDVAAKLSALDAELAELQDVLTSAVEARKDAEHALGRFGAGDAAAQAEARRQEALSEMTAAAEGWVRATVGKRLLAWAIQRYRERRQTPLLQRASELFATLTLGSFERLTLEDDGDKIVILGRRMGGEVGVEGMSDGTRDQLYLSLRIAALELHLDKGEPLPFLADDLFVNWDNERAQAGLRVLAELARRTQVLFLTHHEHLLDLAGEAVGAKRSVVRLAE